MKIVPIEHPQSLDAYAGVAHLAPAVRQLREVAAPVASQMAGRTLWMINSTPKGGGVAEMLPGMIRLLRDLGIRAEWAVIETDRPEFFHLTKRIHNLVHGASEAPFTPDDGALYEEVNRANAAALAPLLKRGDVVVIHDPQPLPLAALLRARVDVRPIWRCHIGLDSENAATRTAWEFLAPWLEHCPEVVFSAPEYVPHGLGDRATIIHPGIDPLASKNREMHVHELVGVLANSALATAVGPMLRPPFARLAHRLQTDGTFRPALWPEELGLLTRPIVTQVSRWDRLKGFSPLMGAFVELKHRAHDRRGGLAAAQRRRLGIARLVMAGPEPEGVADDPEATQVLEELTREYVALDPDLQADIALIALPMRAPRENALMVNALQRASTVVVQNSLREGFGLTVTEAMWKRIPVISNARACGPRHQVRDGIDGRLIGDPENVTELADVLVDVLSDWERAEAWGHNAQRHVHDRFLVFHQLEAWLRLLGEAPPS